MAYQEDWLNRVNAPYLEAARKRQAGFLPADFIGQFEEIPERGFWESFASGAVAQGAGVLQGQAEFANTLGIGDGQFANAMNEVMQENARRREYTWQDMVNDPMKYVTDPEGLVYDLGGGLGSSAVLLGETALTGGIGGAAVGAGAKALGMANKIGGTARMVAAIGKVAEANNMPWVKNILASPAGKMLALNIMKTPLEAASEGGNVAREIRLGGGSEDEQLQGMLSSAALNTVLLTFTNTLESAGLGKLIAKEGGKKALVKKLTGVTQTAAKEAADPNFIQKMLLMDKINYGDVGKFAVGMTANALQNAYEEGAQETIGQYSKGESDSLTQIVNPFAWTDEAITSAAVGGVTGVGQGAVMTGVGKGLNAAFAPKEDKKKDLKVTTPTQKSDEKAQATPKQQPLQSEGDLQNIALAAKVGQSTDELESFEQGTAFDEEFVKEQQQKQQTTQIQREQYLGQEEATSLQEQATELAQNEEQRRNELLQMALGDNVGVFAASKNDTPAQVAPQSPVEQKAWNKKQKGTVLQGTQSQQMAEEKARRGYVGSYTPQGIANALNQSDSKLIELATKIKGFGNEDQLKQSVFAELRKRGIKMGENFVVEEQPQIVERESNEVLADQPQEFDMPDSPAVQVDVPIERVNQAVQKYQGKQHLFEQDVDGAIAVVERMYAENRISKEDARSNIAMLRKFKEQVNAALTSNQSQANTTEEATPSGNKLLNAYYGDNKPTFLALPPSTQQAVAENTEEAESIFEDEANQYVEENINSIEDVDERKKQARLERDNAHEHLRSLLQPALDVLNAGRNNGYVLAPGDQDNGRMVRLSNNALWYQEFRKERKHKPLVPEMEELAYQLLIDKFPYTKPDEFMFDVAAEDVANYESEMQELKQQLDYARAYYFALSEAYNNALEESKKQAKAKKEGSQDGKSQNIQDSPQTDKGSNDENTTSEPVEEPQAEEQVVEQTETAPQQEKETEVDQTPAQPKKKATKPKSESVLTKTAQTLVDLIKKQINVDLAPFVDNTFKAKRGHLNIDVSKMSRSDIASLESFILKTQNGYGSYNLRAEALGSWGITIVYSKRKKGEQSPVKYSAEELDKKFQAAYHGSPHIFNEFSIEHMGSGEGAQVHGWGLYFTAHEGVAQGYRERLTEYNDKYYEYKNFVKSITLNSIGLIDFYSSRYSEGFESDLESLLYMFENVDSDEHLMMESDNFSIYLGSDVQAAEALGMTLEELRNDKQIISAKKFLQTRVPHSQEFYADVLEIYQYLDSADNADEALGSIEVEYYSRETQKWLNKNIIPKIESMAGGEQPGAVYAVEIPDDDVLLNEQVSLKEQPPMVQDSLLRIVDYLNNHLDEVADPYYLKDLLTNPKLLGRDFYWRLSRIIGGDRLTSMMLNAYGIKGITYVGNIDGHCFVIFDDKAIEIKRRYDIALEANQAEIQQAIEKQNNFLKDALKGGKFELQDDNTYKVTMPNGLVLYASVKDQIIINEAEMQNAKKAHGLQGNQISILGSWQKITSDNLNGFLNISAKTAKDTTAYHEVTHALIDLVLTPKQKQLVFDALKPLAEQSGKDLEEFVCDYVADWRLKRKNAKLFGKLWNKLVDFARQLQAWFTQTENLHNLLRKIDSGEIWQQPSRTAMKNRMAFENLKHSAEDNVEAELKKFKEFLHGNKHIAEKTPTFREWQEKYKLFDQLAIYDAKVEIAELKDKLRKEEVQNNDLDLDDDIWLIAEPEYTEKGKEILARINKLEAVVKQQQKYARYGDLMREALEIDARQIKRTYPITEPPKPTKQTEFDGFRLDKTGMSAYDDVLENIKADQDGYLTDGNNAYIAEMSPVEYMDRCAIEIFEKSHYVNLIGGIEPIGSVERYAKMMKEGTKFNLPVLNYETKNQEGRHRALAAYLNGIDKIPVLIIPNQMKFSAEEATPTTATAKVSAALKSSRPESFWQKVSKDGFFKALWDKFYTDWIDKLKPLEQFDVAVKNSLGRDLKQDEKVRERATAISYNAAGIAHALLDGTAEDLKAVNAMLKNKKLPHEATLQMVLDEIKTSDMNEKYGKKWLKENGFDHWFEGLSNYLLARRLREMWNRRRDEFNERIEMREQAIAMQDEFTQEKIREWDNKVLEWKRNGKEGTKPKKPKNLTLMSFRQNGNKLEPVDVTALPLWSEWEYSLPQNISINTINRMIDESPQEFAKAAEIYYKLNDNLLTLLEDAGIIDAETHDTLNEKYKEYCPLMRDFSDTAGADEFIDGLTSGGKGLANVAVPLHAIKVGGSERAVTSPLESTINAVAVFSQRAERNKVAQLAVKMVNKSGAKELLMEMPFGTKPSVKDSTFTVLMDGKKTVYQCEPSMYGAIAGYNIPTASMVFKVASSAANFLRLGATSSPSFIIRNIIRDTIFAGVSSQNGFIPIYDTIRGWYTLKNNPEIAAEFHAAGVDQFSFYGNGESRYKKLTEMTNEANYGILDPRSWLQFFREYSELAEASTRMGEYLRAREKGKDIRTAAEDARNITLNFTRSGVRGEQVNKVIPFFNAVIQGGDKMFRMFHEDFVGTCVRTFEYIILPSLALWALNHDEDWYKKLNPSIKNQYWCFGKNVKVPKPQELGVLFGSGSEAVLDTAYDIDPKAMANWKKQFLGNLLPSFMPTVLLPLVEWQANYNFFRGKEVVSKSLQRLPDELQYSPATSGISKAIGQTIKVSPAKIDNLVASASGTMGMLFYQGLGMPLDNAQNLPAKHWYELPFLRDFAVTDYNLSRNVNDFYEVYGKAEKEHTGYGKKGQPSLATKNIRKAYKMISDINKDIQRIERSARISPEKKRVLIDKKRDKVDKIAEKIVRKYGEHYL